MASHYHNVALMDGSYTFAKDLNPELLFNGQGISSMKNVSKPGVYAPLTASSNFYIKVGNEKTLVHSYAHIKNPTAYEPFFNLVFSVWETMFEVEENFEVHPAAKWMKETFTMLIEQ